MDDKIRLWISRGLYAFGVAVFLYGVLMWADRSLDRAWSYLVVAGGAVATARFIQR